MSNIHELNKDNFLNSLPFVLRSNDTAYALAKSTSEVLANRKNEIIQIQIYSRIDELPEDLLDIIAEDFKIDWYDMNAPFEKKCEAIKSAYQIKRRHGTKWAVKRLVSIYFENGEVYEWFEYGGEPHHFRISCDDPSFIENFPRFMQMLNIVKRCSSWLDNVTLRMLSEMKLYTAAAIQEAAREYYRIGV